MEEVSTEERLAALAVGERLRFDVADANGPEPRRMEWSALHDVRKQCNKALEAILDAAVVESRDLNAEEAKAYGYHKKLRANIESEMDKRGESGDKGPRGGLETVPLQGQRHVSGAGPRPSAKNVQLISPETGRALPVYGHGEPMVEPDAGECTVGQIACAVATGDFGSLSPSLKAAVTGGGEGGGSYMLEPQVSGRVVDLARSASVAMRAGAMTTPMTTSELTLLRVLSDPTVTPRRELQAVEPSKPTFGKFTLQAKMYSALVPISIEQLEDAANAPSVIESTMRSALGLAMDQAILRGAGGAEVLGITNAENVNEQTNVGTPDDWSQISQAVGSIFAANYADDPEGLAWIANPRDGGSYDRLQAGDNQPLRPTPWAGALQRFQTTSLEVDGGETDMIVGRFPEILVGMRTGGVVFDVVDGGSVTVDGEELNAATQFVRFLRARVRFDAVLMRPDWFTVLRGVTA